MSRHPIIMDKILENPYVANVKSHIEQLGPVPQPVIGAFAGIGALWLGCKLFSYLQLILGSFIFTGHSVSRKAGVNDFFYTLLTYCLRSFASMDKPGPGPSSLGPQMALVRSTPLSSPPKVSTSSLFPEPSPSSNRSPRSSKKSTTARV